SASARQRREAIVQRSGVNLVREIPEVARWLSGLDGPLVLGNYFYADGAANVAVCAAVDVLTMPLPWLTAIWRGLPRDLPHHRLGRRRPHHHDGRPGPLRACAVVGTDHRLWRAWRADAVDARGVVSTGPQAVLPALWAGDGHQHSGGSRADRA